jgi:hypothetical protein
MKYLFIILSLFLVGCECGEEKLKSSLEYGVVVSVEYNTIKSFGSISKNTIIETSEGHIPIRGHIPIKKGSKVVINEYTFENQQCGTSRYVCFDNNCIRADQWRSFQ